MVKAPPSQPASPAAKLLPQLFAGCYGALLGLALLKFGNPPIMEKYVVAPTNGWEFVINCPWPITWGYWCLGLVTVLGLFTAEWRLAVPRWLLVLPLLWLGWQALAASQAVDPDLARPTLTHFASCLFCFYLGCFALGPLSRLGWFWVGLFGAFFLMLATGWEQHFGGLEETRRYFLTYVYPSLKEVPPEYLKKISSNRIFATLFYPNALAGALLLLMPIGFGLLWQMRRRFTPAARWFLAGLGGLPALACLYWSGSKGGWLLMLLLGLLVLLRLPLGKRLKLAMISAVLLLGLVGFFWKYSAFFQKGATSVSARFDYWHAAVQTAATQPLLGTGPGTFSRPYERLKRPDSEMSRLVHNDYLEQASDSGLPGFALYLGFILAALVWSFKQLPTGDWLAFSIWLGVFGWAAQGVLEFGLYIPALAWPAFALLGWLLRQRPSGPPV